MSESSVGVSGGSGDQSTENKPQTRSVDSARASPLTTTTTDGDDPARKTVKDKLDAFSARSSRAGDDDEPTTTSKRALSMFVERADVRLDEKSQASVREKMSRFVTAGSSSAAAADKSETTSSKRAGTTNAASDADSRSDNLSKASVKDKMVTTQCMRANQRDARTFISCF